MVLQISFHPAVVDVRSIGGGFVFFLAITALSRIQRSATVRTGAVVAHVGLLSDPGQFPLWLHTLQHGAQLDVIGSNCVQVIWILLFKQFAHEAQHLNGFFLAL